MITNIRFNQAARRHVYFLSLVIVAGLVFRVPLLTVARGVVSTDQYSHALMVVPISGVLIWLERKRIFAQPSYSVPSVLLYLATIAGGYLYTVVSVHRVEESNRLALSVLFFAVSIIAAFRACYGATSMKAASFPLFFLLLAAPPPSWLLDRVVTFLQQASAHVTSWFFTIAGVNFVREGTVISLPEVTIEVARECSGIRSSLILVISGLFLAYLFLKSPWLRLILVGVIVPVAIFKNALRIFTLTMLATRVDPSFLTGHLHHDGGIVFFAIAFAILWCLVLGLQRIEGRAGSNPPRVRQEETL